MQTDIADKPLHAVIAAVQLPQVSDFEFESSLTELRELAKTLGYLVVHTFVQKRTSFDTTGYLGVRQAAGDRRLRQCRQRGGH